MKKQFIILLLMAGVANLSAEMSVKSFSKVEKDMDARIDARKTDQNGEVCAIIKVETTQTGFSWDSDASGITAVVPKVGEYWIYVPNGAKRLTIKHPQLGILRDYLYPLPIEKATVYVLSLVSGKITTIVEETIESQWLLLRPTPTTALVYIDNQFMSSGEYSAKLKPGSYAYKVEAPLYHSEVGKLEISDGKKEMDVVLRPAFGYVQVSSAPESGAKIIIDGKEQPQTTPAKSEALASGEHTVQVIRAMYQPSAQRITVSDGQTVPVNFTLQPNFAQISITAPASATLLINGAQKATGTWSGRLNAGVYTLEARMDKHRTAKQDIELSAGDTKTIDLRPTPIYGSVDVISSPSGATIMINGKDCGTTPNTINKLLIGSYELKMSKEGYATTTEQATIVEGQTATVNKVLSNGRTVAITTNPAGANLIIDGNSVGTTPYNATLTYGTHTIRATQGDQKTEKIVTISATGGETSFTLSFGPQSFTATAKGVNFDMVAVKGGTFEMGSDNGESDEKPTHSVTLNDFYMAKTEVTQALYQAVMGSNPSNFKGGNLPVEQVSWDDCQAFIAKLNQLTGKRFRLPTEAEWEYAAGGGTPDGNKYAGTDTDSELGDYAWYTDNSGSQTHPVATKKPNALGICDMSGNVWEWCSDWYDDYSSSAQTNPAGASSGSHRVARGGSWGSDAADCRSAFRGIYGPTYRSDNLGLRLAFSSK